MKDVKGLQARIARLQPVRSESEARRLVRALRPTIRERTKAGVALQAIYEEIREDLGIAYSTFRDYVYKDK